GEEAVVLRLGAPARRPLEQRPQPLLERVDPLEQAGAITPMPVLLPRFEAPSGDRGAGLPALLLRAGPLARGADAAPAGGPAGRADGARRELGPEGVALELAGVASGDAGSTRERRARRLHARAERWPGNVGRELSPGLGGTSRAAQPMQAMLADRDRDRRQL